MKAWLITWEWVGNAAITADKVAGILNPRWGPVRVADIVEFLYSNINATVNELASYAKHQDRNPYRADINGDKINCGHNPSLYARKVSDLKISSVPDTRLETISWKEPPRYKLIRGKMQMVKKPFQQEFQRRIEGSLLHKLIWDRANDRFYDGWGPGETPPDDNW